ncbi:Coenzyme F420 hydrogenase/dehydrogenase, beta subunit C-terminal domain [Pedobacter sp.]|uniref:Coenzyme F420 hydrogenase/dehydrogenase, beta subunit C-terminal domain n=1 Tax=Pedobacter sp. TaxID=1411316 RepID=UPI003D7FE444
MNNAENIKSLVDQVIVGGYCIGCGACAALDNSPISIKLDEYAKLQAVLEPGLQFLEAKSPVLAVCPFSNESPDEDEIGKELYGLQANKHEKLGFAIASYAGFVSEGTYRKDGSSGGMGTWILNELLKSGLVDGIIHVKERVKTKDNPLIFEYAISTTQSEVLKGAKSRYYPIELSEVIRTIKSTPGRYAIVGLPCFIKAIRLLQKNDSTIADRIKFCVALVCGHLKSANFGNMWAWQIGVHPNNVVAINFRNKLKGYGANKYGVAVKGDVDGQMVTKESPPLSQLYGADWGWGLFKYKACDFCDDVVGETADLTIGDAWLPQYLHDSEGTNIIVIRNQQLKELVDRANVEKRLNLEEISFDEVVKSQQAGFLHRREGLAYRLYLTDIQGKWRPIKRVQASDSSINDLVKARQRKRIELAEKSHVAFKKALAAGEFSVFKQELAPAVSDYKSLYKVPFLNRVINRLKKIANIK